MFLGDMPTEIITTKSDAATDNQALNLWKTDNFNTNGTLMNFFKYSYIAINRANAVIKKLPDTDMPDALRNQYMGEAYFLRAYNYYYLSCNFGLVPIHKGVVETLEQTSAPLATNMDELYDFIIEDLKLAEELMPGFISARSRYIGVRIVIHLVFQYCLWQEFEKIVRSFTRNSRVGS